VDPGVCQPARHPPRCGGDAGCALSVMMGDVTRLRPTSIRQIDKSTYEVTFASATDLVLVRCSVESGRGGLGILPTPDVFISGDANSRAVTAAVIAFHKACNE